MLQRLSSIAMLFTWAAAAAMAQTATTAARTSYLPPFGLGSTETARVNLSNIATTAAGGTAASCTGTVSFVNASGTTIGTATAFTVGAGQTSPVSLPFGSSGLTAPRGELRVVLQVTRPATGTVPPCSLLTSLETFDTSGGATHLFLAGPEVDLSSRR